jgi:hypothetical protein
MWRTAFLVTWFGCLGLVGLCWQQWQAALATAGEGLPVLTLMIAVVPWAAGPGLLPVLRRMKSGGVNLPHADHWFTGERRAASLTRLAPFLDALGLMLTLFLTALLGLELWHGLQGLAMPDQAVLPAALGFLLLLAVWTWRLMRAFPAPVEPAMRASDPKRRRGQP